MKCPRCKRETNNRNICPICGYNKGKDKEIAELTSEEKQKIEKTIRKKVKEDEKTNKFLNGVLGVTNAVLSVPIVLDTIIIIYFIIRFIFKFNFNIFDILAAGYFLYTFRYFAHYIIIDVIFKLWDILVEKRQNKK